MTQDEHWYAKNNEVKAYIEENHRNQSKPDPRGTQVLPQLDLT